MRVICIGQPHETSLIFVIVQSMEERSVQDLICVPLSCEAHLIHMANARKNRANYPSMRIVQAYFIVSRASIRISEGQIIWAILHLGHSDQSLIS